MGEGNVILRTENLTKRFEGLVAVDSVTAEFYEDSLHAIIGPNGAGKTTFFNLLTGALTPTDGRIELRGKDITHVGPSEIARRGLVRSYQVTTLFNGSTILENVAIAVQSKHATYNFWSKPTTEVSERALEILERVGLADKQDTLAQNLSHGEQRTLEIAVTVGMDPKLLLLDEPTSGMSPEETKEIIELIVEIEDDFPIVMIEHKMSVVNEVADRVMVLHNGRKLADDDPYVVQKDSEVRQVYLGETS